MQSTGNDATICPFHHFVASNTAQLSSGSERGGQTRAEVRLYEYTWASLNTGSWWVAAGVYQPRWNGVGRNTHPKSRTCSRVQLNWDLEVKKSLDQHLASHSDPQLAFAPQYYIHFQVLFPICQKKLLSPPSFAHPQQSVRETRSVINTITTTGQVGGTGPGHALYHTTSAGVPLWQRWAAHALLMRISNA